MCSQSPERIEYVSSCFANDLWAGNSRPTMVHSTYSPRWCRGLMCYISLPDLPYRLSTVLECCLSNACTRVRGGCLLLAANRVLTVNEANVRNVPVPFLYRRSHKPVSQERISHWIVLPIAIYNRADLRWFVYAPIVCSFNFGTVLFYLNLIFNFVFFNFFLCVLSYTNFIINK